MSRWESGKVDAKELGLELIAECYGAPVEMLRRPPPAPGAPPTRTIEIPEDQAAMVDAFLSAVRKR